MKKLEPVGDHAATVSVGSDCYPYLIVSMWKKKITVAPVKAVWNSNLNDYEYFECPDATPVYYSLRKNGRYYQVGDSNYVRCLSIGQMRQYLDPCF